MARGERIVATAALLLLGLSVLVNAADAESLFPTYFDDGPMEEEARYGVVSLSGATNNNVTLNLSGILILGMTLSAAVCVWTYSVTLLERRGQGGLLSRFSKLSPSTTSLNYTLNLSGLLILGLSVAAATMFWAHVTALSDNKIKRSLDDDDENTSLPIMLGNMHRHFENAGIHETICRQRIVCEIGAGHEPAKFPENSFGYSVNTYFSSADEKQALKDRLENHKWAKTYLAAWNEGKSGKVCKIPYGQCSMTRDSIEKLIGSE